MRFFDYLVMQNIFKLNEINPLIKIVIMSCSHNAVDNINNIVKINYPLPLVNKVNMTRVYYQVYINDVLDSFDVAKCILNQPFQPTVVWNGSIYNSHFVILIIDIYDKLNYNLIKLIRGTIQIPHPVSQNRKT